MPFHPGLEVKWLAPNSFTFLRCCRIALQKDCIHFLPASSYKEGLRTQNTMQLGLFGFMILTGNAFTIGSSNSIMCVRIHISKNEDIFEEVDFSKMGIHTLLVWRMNPTS